MTEQLPEALRALISAESAAPVVSEAAQVAVRAKLGATLGIAKVATTTAATSATASAAASATAAVTKLKLLAVVIAAGSTTTAVVATHDRVPLVAAAAAPAYVEPRLLDLPRVLSEPEPALEVPLDAAVTVEQALGVPLDIAEVEQALDVPLDIAGGEPSLVVESEPAPPVVVRRAPPPRDLDPPPASPSQATLLADASRAFSSRNASRALAILDEDARAHPDGPLDEERDALRVSVLVALGRITDAQAHARDLLARYPHTMHRALVERVLTKDSP